MSAQLWKIGSVGSRMKCKIILGLKDLKKQKNLKDQVQKIR